MSSSPSHFSTNQNRVVQGNGILVSSSHWPIYNKLYPDYDFFEYCEHRCHDWRTLGSCWGHSLSTIAGLCLIYKAKGVTMPRPPRRRYCVGKCHHRRQFNLPEPTIQVRMEQWGSFYQYITFLPSSRDTADPVLDSATGPGSSKWCLPTQREAIAWTPEITRNTVQTILVTVNNYCMSSSTFAAWLK